jgi:hypothetical protein
MAQNSWLQQVIIGLVVVSMAGSAWSIYTWVKRARTHAMA